MRVLIASTFLVALVACGGGDDIGGSGVVVEMTDYAVKLSTDSIGAGRVKFGVRNRSGQVHDFHLLRTDAPADKLPMEGVKAREEGHVAHIAEIPGGRARAVTAELTPGNYVIICNVPTHYGLGMYAALRVQ